MGKAKMKGRRKFFVQITLLVLGLSLILLGTFLLIFLDPIHDGIIKNAMTFKEGSASYSAWRSDGPPMDMDVYLFNWTNSKDINDPNIKPKFERVGPYKFKEGRQKIDITWNENETISYRHRKMYHFDAGRSERQLTDMVTTVNPISATIAYKVRHSGFFARKAASYWLSTLSSIAVTQTAGEILFDGFDDRILRILNFASFGEIQGKFGMFYGTNGSEGRDGYYNMYYKTDENFGTVTSWNFKNRTNFFTGQCNEIKGSAGEFYPINRKKDKIVLYSPELCRYAALEFAGEVVVKDIKGYKYTGNYLFDNGTTRPENQCFCNGECGPSGVFNVSVCRKNSPTFLSFPNFHHADPYYTDLIEGVVPDARRDEFYIVLEPKSGIMIDFGCKMQVNLLIQPVDDILLFRGIRKAYIPVFYFDQNLPIKDDLVTSIKLVQNFPDICTGAAIGFISVGSLILTALLGLFFYDYSTNRKMFKVEQVKYNVNM